MFEFYQFFKHIIQFLNRTLDLQIEGIIIAVLIIIINILKVPGVQ